MNKEIWFDKLPEDKAAYYNKTRMSFELFARKMGIAPQVLLRDLWNAGYQYNAQRRVIEKMPDSPHAMRGRFVFRGV